MADTFHQYPFWQSRAKFAGIPAPISSAADLTTLFGRQGVEIHRLRELYRKADVTDLTGLD